MNLAIKRASIRQPMQSIWLYWVCLESSFVKSNTDGSSKFGSKLACGGGIVRGGYGNWISGFTTNLGKTILVLA